MPICYIIRGLPGAGKTTHAKSLGIPVVSADDFFTRPDGSYDFDPSFISDAHGYCRRQAAALLNAGHDIAIANTFSRGWEVRGYTEHLVLIVECDIEFRFIDLFDAGLSDEALAARCVHGVPVEKIAAMRARWERNL